MKRRVQDLAIYGGPPLFERELHVGRPNLGDRAELLALVESVYDRKWLSNDGLLCRRFEAELALRLGVSHCIAVSSATAGLELAVRALGLSGEVIVPSFTFVGTAHALQWLGVRPIFCDVAPGTHLLDPDHVERLIGPQTTGILGVHLWGHSAHVDALTDIARRHNLTLFFDAAHAFGCSDAGRPIGGLGRVAVFSFHATKVLSTGEGGALTTNDAALGQRLRQMRNFGIGAEGVPTSIGTNAKLSELAAALGLVNLGAIDAIIAVNRRNYEQFQRELEGVPGVRLKLYVDEGSYNYHYIIVEFDPEVVSLSRDRMVNILQAERILARHYFHPGCHRVEPYRSQLSGSPSLPHTEALCARVMALPTGTQMSPADITNVCELLKFVVSHATEIR